MLMYSATFPPAVQDLAMKNMVNHIFITTGTIGSTNLDVQQRFLEVTRNEKKDKLCEELRNIGNAKTIVFADTKKTADFLASFLSQKDFKVIVDYFFIELLDFLIISLFQKATSIHGDRLQSQRDGGGSAELPVDRRRDLRHRARRSTGRCSCRAPIRSRRRALRSTSCTGARSRS